MSCLVLPRGKRRWRIHKYAIFFSIAEPIRCGFIWSSAASSHINLMGFQISFNLVWVKRAEEDKDQPKAKKKTASPH